MRSNNIMKHAVCVVSKWHKGGNILYTKIAAAVTHFVKSKCSCFVSVK